MDDVIVPAVYVVSRKLSPEDACSVIRALSITPCQCSIISDVHDGTLALELCANVLRAATDKDALSLAGKIAKESQRPVLVVGDAPILDGIMPDGSRIHILTEN